MDALVIIAICSIPLVLILNFLRYKCFFCVNEAYEIAD
jgi:hypothetical protein